MVETIRMLCDLKGISINKLEKECGLSTSTVNKWDNNTPSVDKIEKVANYFGVTIDYIVTGKEKQPAENGKLSDRLEKIMEYAKRLSEEQQDFLITQLSAFQHNK